MTTHDNPRYDKSDAFVESVRQEERARILDALDAATRGAWAAYRDASAESSISYREGFGDGLERAILTVQRLSS